MKKITHVFIVSIYIIFFTTRSANSNLTPSNTIIISDINDVIIQDSLPLRLIVQLKKFLSDSKKKETASQKKDTVALYGIPSQLLHIGMKKTYIAPYISRIVDYLGSANHLIEGTEKIYRYLKDIKGYHIVFATNQDRILYDIVAQSRDNRFTNLANTVFVAQQQNSPQAISQLQSFAQLTTTPLSYKTLLNKVLNVQPTDSIVHVPSKKPAYDYYHYVEEKLDTNKNMIFIDDKLENVRGFEALQAHTSARRIGIEFKNPEQLADELIALGIVSESDDREFLQELRHSNWWHKIKSFFVKKSHNGAQRLPTY